MEKYKNPATIEEILERMLNKYGQTYTPLREENHLARSFLTAASVKKLVEPAVFADVGKILDVAEKEKAPRAGCLAQI